MSLAVLLCACQPVPPAVIPVPALELDPASLAFSNGELAQTVKVKNVGDPGSRLRWLPPAFTVGDAFVVSTDTVASAAVGEELEVSVSVPADAFEHRESVLSLNTNAGGATVRLAADLKDESCHYLANPPALEFDTVLQQPETLPVTITSTGLVPCVAHIRLEGDGFSTDESSLSFAPGQSTQLSVTAEKLGGGKLHVADLEVPLAAPEPCLILPEAFDFGTVSVGCHSAPQDFRMIGGCGAITIAPETAEGFEIFSLSPTSFRVRFAPTTYGAVWGGVHSSKSTATLQGVGDAPRHNMDTYVGNNRTHFYLSFEPVVSTLTVTGTPNQWVYDPDTVSLSFSIPVTELFTVSYDAVCL